MDEYNNDLNVLKNGKSPKCNGIPCELLMEMSETTIVGCSP